jgi:hypothetical protein
MTPHHDIRYGMALMPYLAVLGTGWIVHLPRAARLAAAGVLVLAVAANTLGSTFGVGGQVEAKLVHSPSATGPPSGRIVFYSSQGGLGVAGPRRDGDVPGLLRALQASGVQVIKWGARESSESDFSSEGLIPLALIAGLVPISHAFTLAGNPANAVLVHLPITMGAPETCTRLSDGTGVWVARGNPATGRRELFCPFPNPHYYPA